MTDCETFEYEAREELGFPGRRKGYPALCQTFPTKQAAVRWAAEQEAVILSGRSGDLVPVDRSLKLQTLVERYLKEISPRKRSNETERYRLGKLIAQRSRQDCRKVI